MISSGIVRDELSQEFLADMPGVHRPSVSLIAKRFQQVGREETVCVCDAVVKRQFSSAPGKPGD